jgi:hypothetical protein
MEERFSAHLPVFLPIANLRYPKKSIQKHFSVDLPIFPSQTTIKILQTPVNPVPAGSRFRFQGAVCKPTWKTTPAMDIKKTRAASGMRPKVIACEGSHGRWSFPES